MALSEETKTASTKSPQKSNPQKLEKREKPPTKVIIRRLPPAIDKETFLNQISPVPHYDYFYIVNGEAALGEHSFSRAYINFVNPSDVFDFKEKFDNYVFLDNKGNEYAAVVEFAAFQKIPKKRNKNRSDPKSGSIETDPIYLEFVENLNKPVEQEDKPEYSYQFLNDNKDSKDTTTPLLEFVRNRRVEKLRIREERREERRRKELERKKLRDEERKKRYEENSPTKVFTQKSKNVDDKECSDSEAKDEKPEKYFEKPTSFRNKERKFEERKRDLKTKPSPRKEFTEKREFKSRREYYKEPKFDYKKEEKEFPKKVKKYSEKREERKIEAQKSELKKAEELENKKSTLEVVKEEKETEKTKKDKGSEEKSDKTHVKKEKEQINQDISEEKVKESVDKKGERSDTQSTKEIKENKESRRERIRNKDRPTIAIYRPGMLSKRKLNEGEADKECSKEK